MSVFYRVLACFMLAALIMSDTIVAAWLLLDHGFLGLVAVISVVLNCYFFYMVGRCSRGR